MFIDASGSICDRIVVIFIAIIQFNALLLQAFVVDIREKLLASLIHPCELEHVFVGLITSRRLVGVTVLDALDDVENDLGVFFQCFVVLFLFLLAFLWLFWLLLQLLGFFLCLLDASLVLVEDSLGPTVDDLTCLLL